MQDLPDPIATDRDLMKHATGVLQAALDKKLQHLGPRSVFVQVSIGRDTHAEYIVIS